MSDINDAYQYANSVIALRRSKDFAEFDRHYSNLCDVLPEAAEIFERLGAIQSRLLRTMFGHDSDLQSLKAQQKELSSQLRNLLIQNNFDEDYLEVKYTCNTCGDTGVCGGENCTCFLELVSEYSLKKLCDESLLKKCTFDSFKLDYYSETENEAGISPRRKMRENLEFCKEYAKSFDSKSKNILMLGKTGLGKTHMSLAIAAAAAKKGVNVIYGSVQNILRDIEREHFSIGDEIDKTLQAVLNCDLLVLDDLGTELDSKFNLSCIYNIINTRINFSRPTIINTNLELGELEQRYTQRVVSRLLGNYACLRYLGNDIRQLKSRT